MSGTANAVGRDDFSLSRVPESARRPWFSIAVQRFGQIASFHQFLLGAVLGFGMTFWNAVLAITLGAAIMEVITVLLGVAGMREGLSTSVLTRWSGFGHRGSALVGLLMTISLAGWFGVQNGAFAQGLSNLLGGPPLWAWSLIGGMLVTGIVVFGIHGMAWTAYLTVPAFLLLSGYAIWDGLRMHSLSELMSSAPPGPALSLAAGTTLVSGAFIMGAIMTPDLTRFNRSTGDVVKQTVLSVTLGEFVIGLIGVLLAHAAKTSDVVNIITSSSGFLGTLILVAAILKVNDWNLYCASLGLVNTIDVLLGKRTNRIAATLGLGLLGSVLSALGILGQFQGFLTWIGVISPPIAGIIIAEYFLVRSWRPVLEESRARGELPATAPTWVPAAVACWVFGAVAGAFLPFGIPTLTSVLAAFLGYLLLGRFGLTRGIGSTPTATPTAPSTKEEEHRVASHHPH
ncbi:cytosine permease [Crossiella sp. SN42]|uniref:purine-cytosine permease family protein n=1 Tax=Crossiella sp. SN42 TaxID=2944808 RepID=UPI00207C1A1F|nr:cytosine permease [Crossiella sp. SN42]MCO1578346.1 cytosine permease [Crossiella sp. SN42]